MVAEQIFKREVMAENVRNQPYLHPRNTQYVQPSSHDRFP